jgi:predicted nucleotidyltransferase
MKTPEAIVSILLEEEFSLGKLPTVRDIKQILATHPLYRYRGAIKAAYLVGSFARNKAHATSDVDIVLIVPPRQGYTPDEFTEKMRQPLRRYFMQHDIQGKHDAVHPQWDGRRMDIYFEYDLSRQGDRPWIRLQP